MKPREPAIPASKAIQPTRGKQPTRKTIRIAHAKLTATLTKANFPTAAGSNFPEACTACIGTTSSDASDGSMATA